LRVVFFGTSAFAVPSLDQLVASGYEVVAVVTQPDSFQGRGKKVLPHPIKELAMRHGLNIYQFDTIKEAEAIKKISLYKADLIVVVSYGQIIPEALLQLPLYGCINVHASLLPKYRGAAPIRRALMAGEDITGVSIMKMDQGLDTGDVLMQETMCINEEIDHGELEGSLSKLGARSLVKTIELLKQGLLSQIKQNDDEATYARKLQRGDESVNWKLDVKAIHNQIRAMSPVPGAYTNIQGQAVKIFRAKVKDTEGHGTPGQLLAVTPAGLLIQTGQGRLEILEMQKPGKRRMKALECWQGMRLQPGIVFTES